MAIQNPQSKLWDSYGIVTEVTPYHRYYIKTQEGRVLVHNRCFLCQHVPTSIPAAAPQQKVTHCDHTQEQPPRHSTRTIHPK